MCDVCKVYNSNIDLDKICCVVFKKVVEKTCFCTIILVVAIIFAIRIL